MTLHVHVLGHPPDLGQEIEKDQKKEAVNQSKLTITLKILKKKPTLTCSYTPAFET